VGQPILAAAGFQPRFRGAKTPSHRLPPQFQNQLHHIAFNLVANLAMALIGLDLH
jgi:hypothetical protein